MSREEKQAEARRLRDEERLSVQQIAERMGYKNHASAWKLLNPERAREMERRSNKKRGPAKRAHENAHRAPCPECGQPMQAGSGYGGRKDAQHKRDRCFDCFTMMRRTEVDDRARRIEKWWAEGLKMKQIGARLGWTENHVHDEIDRLRGKGYDIPYRYKPGKRNATAHPEQVAA